MGIYSPNLDKFSSVYFIAPRDEYELEVIKMSVRTVEVTDKKTQTKTKKPVVGCLLRIVSGTETGNEYSDKPVSADFWLSEDERDWNKLLRFVAACKGFKGGTDEGDEAFRNAIAGLDLSVDPENNKLGSGYEGLVKSRVRCTLTQNPGKADPNKMYQNFGTWLPF